jgi:cytochrome c-type biogenesis protein
MAELNLFIAFFAGLASFLSPCILPLVPAFLSYLSGVSIAEAQKSSKARLTVFLNSVFFVLGFSLVFSVLGILLNGALSSVGYIIRIWLSRIGGIIIIIFGLYLTKLISIPFLEKEYRIAAKKTFKISYLNSFVFGLAFATGWTPCIGAILGSILTLAAVSSQKAFILLLAYSLGLSLPFLISGLFISGMQKVISRYSKEMYYINIGVGIILIILGILVFTNRLASISNFYFLQSLFSLGQ